MRNLTHLIADTYDFPAYQDAIDGFIHVVSPAWVEQSILKKKTANPRQFRPDPNMFMSDAVVAFADGIPEGDKDAIIGGLIGMGGQYSSAITKLVTHIISLTMDCHQAKLAVEKRLKCKIVLPHWFDHCLILGRRIDEGPYTLPDPSILEAEKNPGVHQKDNATSIDATRNLEGASMLSPLPPMPCSPSKNRKNLGVFRGLSIFLSPDLELTQHLKDSLTELIQSAHGKVVTGIDLAHILICKYRTGLDFCNALENGKDIGSLGWLYHLLNTNKWTSPTRRLLHFPVPKVPIRGFSTFKISVSNYTGDARIYLENLIKAAGGSFTKTMTQANTHLITAHSMSEKVEAAQEWGINAVNHLWLEESYAMCKVQSMTNPRYTTFPAKTNLGEVVGQTQIDKKIIEEICIPHKFASPQREEPTAVLEPKCSNARTPGSPTKSRKTKTAVTPGETGKENATPGSRGAKDRAIDKLHCMAGDIELYQKEMKRKGGVLYGGRKVTDVDRIQLARKRDASLDEEESSEDDNTDAEAISDETRPKKKNKIRHEEIKLRYVVTGGTKFGWNPDKTALMRKLGLREIDEVPKSNNFDLLVSSQVVRTLNFLAAIAAGVPIVRPAWLEDSLKAGRGLDVKSYELLDLDFERKGTSLQTILQRAQRHFRAGGMLKGMTVYCTENVKSGQDKIVDVVERNGGKCIPYKGRETRPPSRPCSDNSGMGERLHLISVPRDKQLWAKFKNMAVEGGFEPHVVTADWILQACLNQDLSVWADEYYLDGHT